MTQPNNPTTQKERTTIMNYQDTKNHIRNTIKMKTQYTDGTSRITSDDREVIENIIREDVGENAVIYSGLVWADEESSENDDGAKAVAKLWNDDGSEFTDELDSLPSRTTVGKDDIIKTHAAKFGLEVCESRITGNTHARLTGCDEILTHWDSYEDLIQWAWSRSGDDRFLKLMEEMEESNDT